MSLYTILNDVRLRQFGSIFGESQMLIYAQALGSTIPGCNILCNPNPFLLSKTSLTAHPWRLWSEMRYYVNQAGKRLFSIPACIFIPLAILNLNIIVELCNQSRGLSWHKIVAIISSVNEEVAL